MKIERAIIHIIYYTIKSKLDQNLCNSKGQKKKKIKVNKEDYSKSLL